MYTGELTGGSCHFSSVSLASINTNFRVAVAVLLTFSHCLAVFIPRVVLKICAFTVLLSIISVVVGFFICSLYFSDKLDNYLACFHELGFSQPAIRLQPEHCAHYTVCAAVPPCGGESKSMRMWRL